MSTDVMPTESSNASAVPETEPEYVGETDEREIDVLDVTLDLSEEKKKEIVCFLEDNLSKMKVDSKEQDRIRDYFSIYEMAAKRRNFPYEEAPSIASSDMYDSVNEFLDNAETAFLQQKVTFSIDREDSPYNEEECRRIESTVHREAFQKNGFSDDFRLMLFEAAFLGCSYIGVRENYDIQPRRVKVIIRNAKDLADEGKNLSYKQMEEANKAIANGEQAVFERDMLKIVNVGPVPVRIDQTKFMYPRNTKSMKEWQVVAEVEYYTASALRELAARGELDEVEVEKAIKAREELRASRTDAEKEGKKATLEDLKVPELDVSWQNDSETIEKMGDSYEEEFAVYRTTMLYSVPTKLDPNGVLRTWIQTLYCPAGSNLLGSKFCQDGFPYHQIQLRSVPYKAGGVGMAQARFSTNKMDSDLKSYALAAIEQEVGAPLLLRDGSGLFATDFRAYPGSATITQDVKNDAAFLPFPEKSMLAAEGIKLVLGSSPMSNKGAGYASGKREELLMQDKLMLVKARIHALANDFDKVFNAMWKIYCRMSKLNTTTKKYIPWVFEKAPQDKKLYVLEGEMNPDIHWSCALSSVSLTPDARLQRTIAEKDMLHDKVSASVNSPRLSIAWLNRLADHFEDIDPKSRAELLPNEDDFAAMQAQLGQQGAEMGGAPGPQGPKAAETPLVSQSKVTGNRNPAAK